MINDITKNSLEKLLPLFKLSYPEVKLSDELDYFPKDESKGWCYIEKDGHPSSFLRYFIQGESPRFATFEIIIKNNEVSLFEKLSSYCIAKASPLEGISQRFELSSEQEHFIPHLQRLGFDRIIKYHTFIKTLEEGLITHTFEVNKYDFDQINEALKVFQTFTYEKLSEYSQQERIHYLMIQGTVVAAAWISFTSDEIELIEIASHPDHKRKGHAKNLLASLEHWAYAKGYKKISLRVKEENSPALKLYNSLNYKISEEKTEYWVCKN